MSNASTTALSAKYFSAVNASTTYATTTYLGIGGQTFTNLSGTGLTNSSGVLTLDTSGNWGGTFGGFSSSYYLNNSFSSTSASYFLSQNNIGSFSTTSVEYWKDCRIISFLQVLLPAFLALNQGSAFSTTSASYWLSQTAFAGASTTLLADNNSWSGTNTFNGNTVVNGNTTFSGGYIDDASSTHTAFTQFANASTTLLSELRVLPGSAVPWVLRVIPLLQVQPLRTLRLQISPMPYSPRMEMAQSSRRHQLVSTSSQAH